MKKIINMTKIKTNIGLLATSMFLVIGCGGEGSDGEVSVDSLLITVPDNISPVAKVNAVSIGIVQGQTLIVDASESSDEDGNIVSYLWQLSDGTNLGESQRLIYNNTGVFSLGTYTLRLIVTDDDGATAVTEITLFINARPVPVPDKPNDDTAPEETNNEAPLITLNGTSSMTLLCGEAYMEQNATAADAEDGTLTVTTSGTVDTTTAGSYTVTYSATDSDGNTATKSRTIMVIGIVHNGTSYCTVTSPYTGKVWLDRNLGAARVCESFDDTACYGDYYQWGRNFDGHQDGGSATTDVQALNVNSAGTEFIITLNYAYDRDWAQAVDSDGSIRSVNWSKTDGSSVCPMGFRVPNITELKTETLDNGVTDRDMVFTNFLKLPSAGFRGNNDGGMVAVGEWCNIWSSSPDGLTNGASDLLFNATSAGYMSVGYRANGLSVRCIKN